MNRACLRPVLAGGLVLTASWLSFGELTRDFSAFTSEQARRIDIRRVPARVPDFRAHDRDGREFGLFDDRGRSVAKPRVTIISFMYTRCVSICTTTGSSFEQLQRQIVADRLQGVLRLVTVSIDPEHDTAEALARYAQRVHADPDVWTVVSVARLGEMSNVMRAIVDVDSPSAAIAIAGSLALAPDGS